MATTIDPFDPRPSCPSCTTARVRIVPWTIRSRPGDSAEAGPTVWECLGCGHVWRQPAMLGRARALAS